MSIWRVILRSLIYHRRIHASVVMGVAAAAAVLTGSLLVGASMRGSLKDLTLRRLGDVDEVLVLDRFIERDPAIAALTGSREKVAGVLWLPGSTVESSSSEDQGGVRRASAVQVMAGDNLTQFWQETHADLKMPETGEVILNQSLAEDLGIAFDGKSDADTLVTIRLPRFESLSSDSPLGEKEDLTLSLTRLRVIGVIPDEGLGRFSLTPSQLAPRNAIVSTVDLEEAVEADGKINSIWLGDSDRSAAPSQDVTMETARKLQPSLSDYGILLSRSTIAISSEAGSESSPIGDAWYVTTDRMVIDNSMASDLGQALEALGPVRVLTYLANDIDRVSADKAPDGKSGIPFSMVTAVDWNEEYRLSDEAGEPIAPLASDEIVLNRWAAEDLGAQVGETIRMTYFLPETTHGQTIDAFIDLKLVAIAGLTEPSQPYSRRRAAEFTDPPTLANDPELTPQVPGVTDQESIENWDLPFPTADRLRDQDDEYWDYYRTTPKAFVSLATGQKLWGSRFGQVTGFRIDTTKIDQAQLERTILDALHAAQDRHGFEFMAVKQLGLRSASGTTPFDGLFLGLSMFVILAALMLIVLLFRLGLERRLDEIGTLLATGFSRRRVARMLVGEGLIVAMFGAGLGTIIGVAYAALMVWGLTTWWVGAIRTPFLTLHLDPLTLALGWIIAVLVCVATLAIAVFRFRSGAVRDLLQGRLESGLGLRQTSSLRRLIVGLIAAVAMIGALIAGSKLGGEMQAGAFLGAGAAALVFLLTVLSHVMNRDQRHSTRWGLLTLAWRNALRNPTRSLLTIGLVAAALFLIGGVSAFRMAPTDRGTAGFDLQALTSRPIFVDWSDATEREASLGNEPELVKQAEVLAFRWRRGDDASCNNPFRANQPQVLGVSSELIEYFEGDGVVPFGWAGVASDDEATKANPWRVLADEQERAPEEPIPVVLDKNTAMWGLQIYSVGQEFTIDYEETGPLRMKAVAFLDNTILQGRILMSDREFRRRFPNEQGESFFLIKTGASNEADQTAVRTFLEDRLGDFGFSTRTTRSVLLELLAVQNTYLSTFQALGALGLLLGTFGLATVQLRSVLERRSELALMQALGYRRSRLVGLVFCENTWLLTLGVGMGVLAAAFVLIPHWWAGNANIPWQDLGQILLLVVLIGMTTGTIAVRGMLGLEVKESLGRS